jgi:hypothetical protein
MTVLTASAYPEFAAVTERPCTKCRQAKPLDQFSRAPKGKYGRKGSGKACDAARHAANQRPSQALPPEELAARRNARRGAAKTCTRCRQAIPHDEFQVVREGLHGPVLNPWCGTCEQTEFIDDAERDAMAALGLVGKPCACGCGEMTKVDVRRKRVGKYLSGHNSRVAPPMPAGSKHTDEAKAKIREARAKQVNVVGGGVDPRSPIDRFREKVNVTADCWEWTAAKDPKGYGAFGVGSTKTGTERVVRAHRFAYEHHVGPVPDGLELDHLCNNRACVNPAHLEPVTHQENIRRAVERRKDGCIP